LIAADLTTGAVIWERPGLYDPAPLAANGLVFASSRESVDVINEDNGAVVWSWPVPANESLPLAEIVTNNLLFVWTLRGAGNMTHVIDLDTHQEVWSYPAGGHSILSPDGLLLIAGSSESEMVAIKAR